MQSSRQFQLLPRDGEWSEKLSRTLVSVAINSAYMELPEHPSSSLVDKSVLEEIVDWRFGLQDLAQQEKLSSAGNPHVKSPHFEREVCRPVRINLILHSAATCKLEFLLSGFLRCVFFAVRSLFLEEVSSDVDFVNTSELLTCALNIAGNKWDPTWEEPDFLKRKTLEQIYRESIERLSARSHTSSKQDDLDEREELETLALKFSRHTLVLFVALGHAKDPLAAAKICQLIVSLIAEVILDKRLDYDAQEEEEEEEEKEGGVARDHDSSVGANSGLDKEMPGNFNPETGLYRPLF